MQMAGMGRPRIYQAACCKHLQQMLGLCWQGLLARRLPWQPCSP